MRFASRFAAFKAMVLADHVRNMGLGKLEWDADGSVRFKRLGVYWHLDLHRGKFVAEQVPVITIQSQTQDYTLPASSDGFAARGDAWNARNYQHDAGNPHGRARRNAFGDLCHKPDIEGYHPQDFDTTMRNHKAQIEAQRRVREERAAGSDDSARRLAVARMRYLGRK
jgi:hypothetical protein